VEELMWNVALGVLLQSRNKGFDNFETLNKASRDLLYEECKGYDKEHTVLWMTIELLKLKASNGWSDSSFSAPLELLSKVLPKPNGLRTSTYIAKKIICPLTLGVEKIHASRTIASYTEKNMNSKISVQGAKLVNTNGTTTLRKIPTIIRGKDGRGRTPPPHKDSKGSNERKVSALVMWYLPVIDHLKCMFSNAREAHLLLWHVQRKGDGKIRHTIDGRRWKHFDLSHEEDFSNDPRNIRSSLSTDGMNSFREMRNPHST
jgi:hypothetical protein